MSSSQRENSDSDSEATLPWKINLDQTEVEEIQTKVELLKEYKKIAELWKRMTVPTKLRRDIYIYIDENVALENRMIREIIMKTNTEGQFSDEMYLTPRPHDFTRLGRMWDDLKKAIDEIHVIEFDEPPSKKRRVEKRE
jgi:signal transduction protein with GAF and PtsI domain